MVKLWKETSFRVAAALFAAAAWAAAEGAVARPGTINYFEGQATLAGSAIGATSIGKVEVGPNQELQTCQGKAEVLLTPGVLLRLGDNSAIRMLSPGLTDTRVELTRGEMLLEVADLQKENHLAVVDSGITSEVAKKGLYRFDADTPMAQVYDGKLKVYQNDGMTDVGKGKEVRLGSNADVKPQKFDRNEKDDLYRWSELRSKYLADANAASVQTLMVSGAPGWYGTGWYWNPWYSAWSFVPGTGLWASPFGYSFYSPRYWATSRPVYIAPYAYPHIGRGFATRVPAARGLAGRGFAGRGFAGRSFGGRSR
jgi:hypothetical protein